MGAMHSPPCFYVMTQQQKSYLYAAMAILAWSSVSTAFKISLRHLSPIGLLLISSFSASLFLLAYRCFSKPKRPLEIIRNIRQSIIPALLNPFTYYLVLFEAYNRLRAQEAQALNYTWAIVLSILSIIVFRERFRVKDILALLISFTGVIVISSKGRMLSLEFDDVLGTALAAGSSLIWAAYWILNMRDKRNNIDKLLFNFALGFVIILLLSLALQVPILLPQAIPLYAILSGVYVGIFEMGLTFVLWMNALQLSESTAKVSNLIFLTPFISLLFIRFTLNEPIHIATIAGLILIITSNIIQKT